MREEFTRETSRFFAQDDDGEEYTLIEFTKFYRGEQVGGPDFTLNGPKHYELDDGSPVNHRKDGTFIIIDGGKILRKV